jgi:pSer/pThr/pTyr-binding forkhead associated (FHA) protein
MSHDQLGRADSPEDPPTRAIALDAVRPAPAHKEFVLELTAGPGAPRAFRLSTAVSVVGRAPEAELSVPDPTVSRQHARLILEDGQVTCVDLDSRNGILLNGLRVHSAVLREGDVLQLGDVRLTYRERVV